MPRKSNIRWRKSDTEKLNKEVKRFNDKINRTKRLHPELTDYLPETIKKEDKKAMIEELQNKPRSDFNKELNSLERFSKRGAEKTITNKNGLTTTKWEVREEGLKVAQINRERTRERKLAESMEVTSRGEPVGLKRGEMGSERLNELKPKKFNFDSFRSKREWELYKETIEKQTSPEYYNQKHDLYKMNYIKGMERNFGDYARDTIEKLKQLPSDLFVKTFYKEQEATIEFVYDLHEMETRLSIITDIWDDVAENNPNLLNSNNWTDEQEKELQSWIAKG